jgi:hypothetical protein
MEKRVEDPAPWVSVRGLLAGRASSPPSSEDPSFVSAGRSIVIFLGAFLAFGAGRVRPVDDPDVDGIEGAGRDSEVDLFCLCEDRDWGGHSLSLLSLLSLPYASTSMALGQGAETSVGGPVPVPSTSSFARLNISLSPEHGRIYRFTPSQKEKPPTVAPASRLSSPEARGTIRGQQTRFQTPNSLSRCRTDLNY